MEDICADKKQGEQSVAVEEFDDDGEPSNEPDETETSEPESDEIEIAEDGFDADELETYEIDEILTGCGY